MLSALAEKRLRREFFEIFDSAIFFEGEIPLLRLIQALSDGEDLSGVPSLTYLRDGEVLRTPICTTQVAGDALPVPDFTGLPLSKYLAPEPILPLSASRGCYWRRCTFCTRQHLIDSYRKRSPDKIVEDMRTLRAQYGARSFFFVDECLSPSTLRALAEQITAARLDVRWSCYMRFEAKLADREFCRKVADGGLKMIYFGLESACDRVLGLMQKGTKKDVMARILESTSAAGILNMLLYFVGFPTETRDEALETMEFLLENRRHVTYALAGQFLLEENSPIFARPEDFDITEIQPLAEHSDLGVVYDYETSSGMSALEAGEMKDLINERTRELHQRDFLNRAHLLLS